jgi:hypothetical protein
LAVDARGCVNDEMRVADLGMFLGMLFINAGLCSGNKDTPMNGF